MLKNAVLGVLLVGGLVCGMSGLAQAGQVALKALNTDPICGVERKTLSEAYTIPAGEREDPRVAGRMIPYPERRVPAEYSYRASCVTMLNNGTVLREITATLASEAVARQKIAAMKGEAKALAVSFIKGKKVDQTLTLSNIQCSCSAGSVITCSGFNARDYKLSGLNRTTIKLVSNDKSVLIVKDVIENRETVQKSCQGVAGAIR